ncbi:MAG: glycosyltransferase [Candidatus Dormibacteraeota bacterium]|nr:glycosyltransferase [Candidatus Dormibacteraeota bacterium]
MVRPTVVVLGMLGQMPFAGMAMQVLQYLEGFRRLGCDTYYVEDNGAWPYDARTNSITDDFSYPGAYLSRLMSEYGFAGHWAYVGTAASRRFFGMDCAAVDRLLARTDMLVNLCGATVLREHHLRVPIRVYLETDPFRPQVEAAGGNRKTRDFLAAHTHHFTYAENIRGAGCLLPDAEVGYLPTRPPVVMDWWRDADAELTGGRYTTVTSWDQSQKDIVWDGRVHSWSKNIQFRRFVDLPSQASAGFELAVAGMGEGERSAFRRAGWVVTDAVPMTLEVAPYVRYIASSRAEFSVAKEQYWLPRTGWFSDRSACYLAAGKPVLMQDTGFGEVLPTGGGLFPFRDLDDAVDAVQAVEADYPIHSRLAREIAREHFAAERVLAGLMDAVGVDGTLPAE